MSVERDEKGRLLKGSQIAKKDFTKEMAKHIVSQELYWCARMITSMPVSKLKEMVKDDSIEHESLLTYMAIKKAVAGDWKPLQFVIEMIAGKPTQQVEAKLTEHTVIINIDETDALM